MVLGYDRYNNNITRMHDNIVTLDQRPNMHKVYGQKIVYGSSSVSITAISIYNHIKLV